MKRFIQIVFAASLVLGYPFSSIAEVKQVVGWVEYATIYPGNFKIKAKLDTGARNSSLNAVNIVEFERGGEAFV